MPRIAVPGAPEARQADTANQPRAPQGRQERSPRLVLLLASLTFAGFGVAFAIFPGPMAQTIDIELPTDVARTDFVATYGGFELGMALFLFLCWRRPSWTHAGLIASGCAVGGFALLRLAGIITSATLSPLMLTVFAVEATATVVSFWAARLVRDCNGRT